MGILAVDVGPVVLPQGFRPEALLAGIHRPDDVGVERPAGVAVCYGTHLLLGFQRLVGVLEIDAVAGFVAQREDDHAGVVLGALVHAQFALELQGVKTLVLRDAPPAVALDVRLAAHIEAVFVTEFVETALLRVVAGADGVDVVLLHQFEVAAHRFLGHDVAVVGVVLVDVDALDHHTLAVDEEVRSHDLRRAETDAHGGVVGPAGGVGQGEQRGVEDRLLGAPGLHVLHDVVEPDRLAVREVLRGGDGGGLGFTPDLAAVRVQQGQFESGFRRLFAQAGQLHAEVQHAVAELRVQRGFHDEVADQDFRPRGQIYVTFDAADAPEVLALIVTS